MSMFYLGKGAYLQTPPSLQFAYKPFLGSPFSLVDPPLKGLDLQKNACCCSGRYSPHSVMNASKTQRFKFSSGKDFLVLLLIPDHHAQSSRVLMDIVHVLLSAGSLSAKPSC